MAGKVLANHRRKNRRRGALPPDPASGDPSADNDYQGKPFDQTYTEEILDYQVVPDTPDNRQLLELK